MHPLLAALRRGTGELHTRLDATVQSTQPFASETAYATFLARHAEARGEIVRTLGGLSPPGPWQPRAEAVQLALWRDLRHLGLRHLGLRHLGLRPAMGRPSPAVESPAGLGLLYVLEGSLVGGRIQARQVASRLGPTVPVSFLTAGASPPHRWAQALRQLDDGTESAEVLQAAQTVFRIYLDVFGRGAQTEGIVASRRRRATPIAGREGLRPLAGPDKAGFQALTSRWWRA